MKTSLLRSVERLLPLRSSALLKRLTLFGSSSGASQALMMIYALIVARYLGPDQFGLLAANYALAGLTIFMVNWGMDTWMLREAGAHGQPGRYSTLVLQAKLSIGVIWLALMIIAAPFIRPSLFPRALILTAGLDLLCDTIFMTLISTLNIKQRTRGASQLLLLSRGGRLASALVLILLANPVSPVAGPLQFALLRLCATLVGLTAGLYLIRPKLDLSRPLHAFSTVRASFAYSITEMLALIYAQVDVFLMGLLSTRASLGEYSPAVSLVNAFTILPTSIFYIVVPILSHSFEQERSSFRKEVWKMTLVYTTTGLILAVGTAFFVPPILSLLLGGKYLLTSRLVAIMSPILFFKAISFAAATYLVVVGWQTRRIPVQALSALLNIVLNLVFIPRYGPFGAAWIYVFSELVLMIGYSFMAFLHARSMNLTVRVPSSQ